MCCLRQHSWGPMNAAVPWHTPATPPPPCVTTATTAWLGHRAELLCQKKGTHRRKRSSTSASSVCRAGAPPALPLCTRFCVVPRSLTQPVLLTPRERGLREGERAAVHLRWVSSGSGARGATPRHQIGPGVVGRDDCAVWCGLAVQQLTWVVGVGGTARHVDRAVSFSAVAPQHTALPWCLSYLHCTQTDTSPPENTCDTPGGGGGIKQGGRALLSWPDLSAAKTLDTMMIT